jgi:Flp pilus assembly pilin Flp
MGGWLKKRWARRRAEEGQGLVEYGLIITFIAIVCAVALATLGTTIANHPAWEMFT